MKPSNQCLILAIFCIAGQIFTGEGMAIVYAALVQVSLLFSALCRAIEGRQS